MENVEIKKKFDELAISKEILQAIKDKGFEEPTPIQELTIPALLAGHDVVGQAQTGTGKTAAFGIPIIDRINTSSRTLQALILCPTRELAIQVSEELQDLLKYKPGINVLPIYGGQPIEHQLKALRSNPIHIIVGTPGRVMDHLERRTISLGNVAMFALDEADEMLDMGFRQDIEQILKDIPSTSQKIFFSATMPPEILQLARNFQKDPQFLKVQHKAMTVAQIAQFFVEIAPKQKFEMLSRLLDFHDPKLALIFCNTKRMVDVLVDHLKRRGYFAAGLHGDLKQNQRDRVMDKFRKGAVEVLVATDVAARGLDVENVSMVINFDIPLDEEAYVHRIGRTGRAGRTGTAFTFVAGREMYNLKRIQHYIKQKIEPAVVPTLLDVQERKLNEQIERVKLELAAGHLGTFASAVDRMLDENVTSLDVAAAMLKLLTEPVQPAAAAEIPVMDERPPREERRDRAPMRRRPSSSGSSSSFRSRRPSNRRSD